MAYTTIDKPTDYFNTSTWTATTSAISNLDFSPDWVWIQSTDTANTNVLFDTIRGANERLSPSSNGAEATVSDELMSFDSNGYTLGSSGNTNDTSPSNASYVGWSWRASDSSASSNTDGSITSSVSANTTAGFSIATYTGTGSGATVGHGLGTTPAWVLVKERGASGESWNNFHQSLGEGKTIMLNLTNAEQSSSTMWNNTAPTSSVFSVGADAGSNGSSKTYVAYCFAEKKGYSKFGSYVANSNTDGPFIYLGFKPAFVLAKVSSDTNDWFIFDNKRSTFNAVDDSLFPNKNDAESTSHVIDFLSNGFKIRDSDGTVNSTGNTYIYIAFAEAPFVSSGGIPTTAR